MLNLGVRGSLHAGYQPVRSHSPHDPNDIFFDREAKSTGYALTVVVGPANRLNCDDGRASMPLVGTDLDGNRSDRDRD